MLPPMEGQRLPVQTLEGTHLQLVVLLLGKLLLVVLRLVQSDHHGHAHLLENGHVVLRRERSVLISHIQGP